MTGRVCQCENSIPKTLGRSHSFWNTIIVPLFDTNQEYINVVELSLFSLDLAFVTIHGVFGQTGDDSPDNTSS